MVGLLTALLLVLVAGLNHLTAPIGKLALQGLSDTCNSPDLLGDYDQQSFPNLTVDSFGPSSMRRVEGNQKLARDIFVGVFRCALASL